MGNNNPITKRRLELGLTQVQLAEMLGRQQQSISDWETGRSTPTMRSLNKLSKVLSCSIADLLQKNPQKG
nr:MAG TPA: helix-turn-helix domain protein [Caudoviricetes sp.]